MAMTVLVIVATVGLARGEAATMARRRGARRENHRPAEGAARNA